MESKAILLETKDEIISADASTAFSLRSSIDVFPYSSARSSNGSIKDDLSSISFSCLFFNSLHA
jgi:hypothetical protein